MLAYVPARFEVIRHVRPACSCRKCETVVQALMPELPIPRGMVDGSVLAHIAVAKFCDHLPLYRQTESTPALASISIAGNSPIGSGMPPGCCARWST